MIGGSAILASGPMRVSISKVDSDGGEWEFVGWTNEVQMDYDIDYNEFHGYNEIMARPSPGTSRYTVKMDLAPVDGTYATISTKQPGKRRIRRNLG